MEEISSSDSEKSLDWFYDWQHWPLVPGKQAEMPCEPPQPLPPTPDRLEADCEEIIPSYDTIDIGFFAELLYPSPSVLHHETAPNFSLPTPWLRNGSVFLPECNILSKRPLSQDSELELERSQKCARRTFQLLGMPGEEEGNNADWAQVHCNMGFDKGKYHCMCHKAYTTPYALNRHLDSVGPPRYECGECTKVFGRKDSLRRHDGMEHKGNGVPCPGCEKLFRPDYLSSHLASAQNERCRAIDEAIRIGAYGLGVDVQPVADRFWSPEIAKRVPHRTGGRAVWRDSPDWSHSLGEDVERLAETLQLYRGVKMRPVFRDKREPCALCGMPLGSNEKDLIDHIQHHSLELSKRTYRCDACQIEFLFAADLHLHLEAAATGHCGFRFVHCRQNSSKYCSGHHPPSGRSQSYDNHDRMLVMVSSWQECQLRSHRVAVARLQAELLLYGPYLRHSLRDDELTCMELLSRFSIESVDSFRSEPGWLHLESKEEAKVVETSSDAGIASSSPITVATSSGTFSSSPTTTYSIGTANGYRNTYIDQLKATRSPGGLKTKASGAFYRTKVATRYFTPEPRLEWNSSRVQYISTAAG